MPNNRVQQGIWEQSGDPETVNDQNLTYAGFLGGRVITKQPGPPGSPGAEQFRHKEYQYVQSDSTMTTAPYVGAVAWWADKTVYKVTTDLTKLGRGRLAGVFQGSVTPGYYCFIQVCGPASVKIIDAPTSAPTAAGLIVIPSSTTGKADVLAAGSAATYPPLGVTASTMNLSDNTCIVDLDCPRTP